MPYGTIKVDNIIFTNGGSDQTVTVSGIIASTSGNLTVTGTISGGTVVAPYGSFTSLTGVTTSGTNANFQTITGAVGVYTTSVSGRAVNALTANIVSGVFASGTAAAPSITFTGNTTAGIYSPGADQVAVATSGTGRLFVNASGNVGVGTSSPAKLLHVQSGSVSGAARGGAFTKTLFESSDATATYWEFQAASTATNDFIFSKGNTGSYGIVGYDHVNDALRFFSNSAERLRIDSSGRVGIGTSSPTNTLHVSGTGSTQAVFERTGSNGCFIGLKDNSGNLSYLGTTNGVFSIQTPGSSYSDKLVVTSAGNVGIGTTDMPSDTNLTVLGNFQTGFYRNVTSGNRGYFLNLGAKTSGGFADAGRITGVVESGDSTGYLTFSTRTGGAITEKAQIDSSGRLLVGTSTALTGNTGSYQSQYSKFVAVGNSAGSAMGFSALGYNAAGTGLTNNTGIAVLSFTDNAAAQFASIMCETDAATSAGDYPGRLVFSTTADGSASPTERMRINSSGGALFSNASYVAPGADNAIPLGLGSFRWSAVYAANGTIQTSDQRAKTNVANATLGSDFIKALRPVSYQWIEGGKRHTGEYDEDNNFVYESVPGQRTHWGFIAQEVKQAVDDTGADFGGWVLTDKDDPDSQQALRYDQFIAPLTKALQETMAELESVKAEVAALKGA